MAKGTLYSALNRQKSLENMVCINDIMSKKQLNKLASDDYFVNFTRDDWKAKYPSIDPKYIWCQKSILFPVPLVYYDEEHHIFFSTNIIDTEIDKFLRNGKTSEQFLLDMISWAMTQYQTKNWQALLMPAFSEQSGMVIMSLLKSILEHEEPSRAIYETFMSFYTMVDCGSNVLTAETIAKLEACKTEAQKRETRRKLDEKGLGETITVYRGMGSESTPADKAFSWTTNQTTAYFFACWKDVQHAGVVKGTVSKEDVIEALFDDRDEDELIIRPGKVIINEQIDCVSPQEFKNVVNEESLPRSEELASDLTAEPILDGIEAIYEDAGRRGDHDEKHSMRVALMCSYLFRVLDKKEAFTGDADERDTFCRELLTAAMWHDVGRTHDFIDETHGKRSADLYFEDSSDDDGFIEFLMTYHCLPDEQAKAEMKKTVAEEDQHNLWLCYQILKDADAIDRWRFGHTCVDFFNVDFFRLKESKALVAVGKWLNEDGLDSLK